MAAIELFTGGPPPLDPRPVEKRIGLIVLATDHTPEVDFQRLAARDRIAVHVNRIPYANPTTPDNLRAMQPRLTEAAALILPGEDLDVMAFCCTAASVVIGDRVVEQAVQSAKPGVIVVTPAAAAVRGLRALGARHISVLTPYTIETGTPMADYFEHHGFVLDRFTCLGLTDDRHMARIEQKALVELAVQATAAQSDALFVSCTSVRAASVAAAIEEAIGKPVVTSNQATAWACLRICGAQSSRGQNGQLMSKPLQW
jgi:maleate isomerase